MHYTGLTLEMWASTAASRKIQVFEITSLLRRDGLTRRNSRRYADILRMIGWIKIVHQRLHTEKDRVDQKCPSEIQQTEMTTIHLSH